MGIYNICSYRVKGEMSLAEASLRPDYSGMPGEGVRSDLGDESGRWGTFFAAVNRRLGAPLSREPPHPLVNVLVKAEEVADDAAVQEGDSADWRKTL